MSLPTVTSQLALFIANRVPEYILRTHSIPKAGPGEVLIKVEAVALNPTDWKRVAFGITPLGTGAGNDFSGTVVALGQGSHNVSIGDRVSGRMRPGFDNRNFAFQQFLATGSDLLIKIPDDVSAEQASTLTLAGTTAIVGAHRLFDFPRKTQAGKTLLVCGGSSCVGMYATQFAHLSGLRVVATASPKNFDLVRSLGASSVVDYHAPDAARQILDAAGASGVDFAFDAVSVPDSVRLANEVLKATPQGQKVATVLQIDPALLDSAVQHHSVSINSIYDKAGGDYEIARTVYAAMTNWLKEGMLMPSPVTLKQGGLSGISEGMALLKSGKVSATKLVYRIADSVTLHS